MIEDIRTSALPLVQDVSQTVRYDIEHNECKNVYQWTEKEKTNFIGRTYTFGEILKIGLDDSKGIRIKFKFYLDNTIRNISVNVFTQEYWIGEPINE